MKWFGAAFWSTPAKQTFVYIREAGTFVPASWLFNDCHPSHRFIAVVIKNTNFGKVLSNRSFLYWYELFRDK